MMKNIERKKRLERIATSMFLSLPPAMARRLKEIIDEGFGIIEVMNRIEKRLSDMVADGSITNIDENRVRNDIWSAMASGQLDDLQSQLQMKKAEDRANGVPFTLGGLESLIIEARQAIVSLGLDPSNPAEMDHELPIDFTGWKYEEDAKRLVERNKNKSNDEWNIPYEQGWFVISLRPGEGGGHTLLGPEFVIEIEANNRAQAWDIGRHEVKHAVAGIMSILSGGQPGTSFGVPPEKHQDKGVRQGVPHYIDREDKEGNPISHGLTPSESYQRDDFEFYVRIADAVKKIVEFYGWGMVDEEDESGEIVQRKTDREDPAPENERMRIVKEILSWDDHPRQTAEELDERNRMEEVAKRHMISQMMGIPEIAPSRMELEEAKRFFEEEKRKSEERRERTERMKRGELSEEELKDEKIKEIRFYLGLPAIADNSGKMKRMVDILLDKYVYMNDIDEMMEQPYEEEKVASFSTWMDRYASIEEVWLSFGRNA